MTRYGLFGLGATAYAVRLENLQRILQAESYYRLPLSPAGVLGVLVDQNELLPLLDLPGMLQEVAGSLGSLAEYQVVVASEMGLVALPADQACGIVAEQKGECRPVEQSKPGCTELFRYRQRDYQILDIDLLTQELTQNF